MRSGQAHQPPLAPWQAGPDGQAPTIIGGVGADHQGQDSVEVQFQLCQEDEGDSVKGDVKHLLAIIHLLVPTAGPFERQPTLAKVPSKVKEIADHWVGLAPKGDGGIVGISIGSTIVRDKMGWIGFFMDSSRGGSGAVGEGVEQSRRERSSRGGSGAVKEGVEQLGREWSSWGGSGAVTEGEEQ
jgi:hypothetical protein